MQWLLNRTDRQKGTLEDCTAAQVLLILGTINASMQTLIAMLHTLAVTPEYVKPLREEIRNTVNSDGSIPVSAMKEFGKMDSYFKEVGMHFPVISVRYLLVSFLALLFFLSKAKQDLQQNRISAGFARASLCQTDSTCPPEWP